MSHISDTFIRRLSENQAEIVDFLHEYILGIPNLRQNMNWGVPCYYGKALICYQNAVKNDGIELNFFRGHLFELGDSRLVSKGRKLVAGYTIYSCDDIDHEFLQLLLDLGIELDKEHK